MHSTIQMVVLIEGDKMEQIARLLMLVTLRQSTKIMLLQIIIRRIEMIVKELQGLLKIIQMLITLI